jgi:AcrR family transcriptional regulator
MSPRPNASADEILEITFHLIAEHDLSGVTVDMVAAKAGVSKATIYRRWDSRQALLVAAMTRLRRAGVNPDTGSLRQDLIALLEVLVGFLNRPDTARVLASFLNAAVRDPELSKLQCEISQDSRAEYEVALRRGVARGELGADVDVQHLIDLLIGPFLYKGVVEHTRVPPGDIERVVDAVLAAFGRTATKAPRRAAK